MVQLHIYAPLNEGKDCFNAARGFVGGAAILGALGCLHLTFQCRTRLFGWCSLQLATHLGNQKLVSMPHAALWVVQHPSKEDFETARAGFNAARGFVGGAAANRVVF